MVWRTFTRSYTTKDAFLNDVFCGRDVCFESDVRFAREKRNASHRCDRREQHHDAARHNITCANGANFTISQEIFFALEEKE